MNPRLLFLVITLCVLWSCSNTKPVFNPHQKYSVTQLRKDYDLFQKILEERHPSLYWYISKPSMDSVFNNGRRSITDSLTEADFRKILMRVITPVQCGHTAIQPSKAYIKYLDTVKNNPPFPFTIKTWGDTTVLVSTTVKKAPIKTGDIIDSLNHISIPSLLDTMYQFIPSDGNNIVAKSQRISGTPSFGILYTLLYGIQDAYLISYKDDQGQSHSFCIKQEHPEQSDVQKENKLSKTKRLQQARSLEINKDSSYALMQLHSFSEKLKLKKFFHHSFKLLKKAQTPNLVIDLRLNGGGRLNNTNSLLRYITTQPYKTADSIYALASQSKYSKYIENDFWIKLLIQTSTKKIEGKFHYQRLEKKYYRPRKKYHYDGHIYLLSGGLTYSASTLVLNTLKGQPNVTIVGEPTGGGAYGNTAMLIPVVTLPNTKTRMYLPLFRMVINKNVPQNGQGVQPDIFVGPTVEAIRMQQDYKMDKVVELIKKTIKEQ